MDLMATYLGAFLHAILKFVQRIYYGKGELERLLTDSSKHTILTTDMAGKLILKSKVLSRGRVVDTMMLPRPYHVENLTMQIIRLKKVRQNTSTYQIFKKNLSLSLKHLNGSRYALQTLNKLKNTKYDNKNAKHEETVYKLWHNLMGDTALPARICTEWSEVGFQGTNPETDFRGMGYLGLFVLTSFSENNFSHTGDRARAILNRSRGPADNPLKFYPFACAGIQITNFALELLRTRKLDRWFYELDTSADSVSLDRNVLEIFVRLYAEMFEVLDTCWAQGNPVNVMDFGRIFDDFKAKSTVRLCSN